MMRYSHPPKSMYHADKQIFLLGIREKLHIPFSTMMADHCETSDLLAVSRWMFNIDEAPIHLKPTLQVLMYTAFLSFLEPPQRVV